MWFWRLIVLAVAISAEEEHFLDVKQIVKGTIEAVAKLPIPQQNNSTEGEKNPEDFYRKVHRSSEDEDEDGNQGDSREEEEKPRKKKKHSHKDPTLISIRDIFSKVDPASTPAPLPIPMPPAPISSDVPQGTIASLPVVESDTGLAHSNVRPQYVYQPIVQPDGKTYYQQVLIVPGQVMSGGAMSSINSPSLPKSSSFVQERPLQPKNIVQADYSVSAPTFPPPVEVFQKNYVDKEPPRRASIYPTRFVKPSSSVDGEQRAVQLPQSDPVVVPSSSASTFKLQTTTPRESLYTTKLPSDDEQRRQARVFHEEAVVPPKQVMKESPLRIRTVVDSRVEPASDDETMALRHLKHDEELKKALERHRLEIDPSPPRKRKLRKTKKIKKVLKKTKYVDEEEQAPSVKPTMDEFRTMIRRMPETFEPDDEVVSKDLESLEEKKEVDEDVTEPPKKRRRSRKTGKTRMEDDRRDVSYSRSKEDSHQQDDEMVKTSESTTATTFKRKILRLNKINRESYRSEDEPTVEHKPRKSRSRSRKIKKVKRVRRTKQTPKSTTANASPLRQHCLNIRTFARQFGTIDVDEFAQEHCAFIENYYPHLTCDKRSEYIAECQKYY
ncbi:hypothetical protein TELCIR_04194 [Teladorsagia circumcincta]|uniref:aECM cysteine-cradle domain-containing protein n=1 Tax=Teladorsagia circumcincta TaxID=45464 RepID=A0A2G9UUA7_TELCI|nr:hypothetical protein TELCIR_04194 [Teladorsagia circumcincta]